MTGPLVAIALAALAALHPLPAAAGPSAEPAPGTPWPTGPLRTGVSIGIQLHRPEGSHADVCALEGKAAQRHLPGFAL